jgi:hypothetical protein
MPIFLFEAARQHAGEFLFMALDEAGWRRCLEWTILENMRLLPLPPSGPPLNPAENTCDETRERFFTNVVFDSLDAVDERLVETRPSPHSDPQESGRP